MALGAGSRASTFPGSPRTPRTSSGSCAPPPSARPARTAGRWKTSPSRRCSNTWTTRAWRRRWAATSGLCLPHFSRALELVEDPDRLQRLLRFQRQALRGLCDELSVLIRKHDYRFKDEGLNGEGDSWLRAALAIPPCPDVSPIERDLSCPTGAQRHLDIFLMSFVLSLWPP